MIRPLLLLALSLVAAQMVRPPVNVRILPAAASPGPQASIRCPAGAVTVPLTRNLATVVNASPAGTSFCVQAGRHTVTTPLYLERGDTLTGQYGAVISGAGITREWDVNGLAIVSGWNCAPDACADVTVRNLVVEGAPHLKCIGVFGRTQFRQPAPAVNSDRWTIDHVETRGCGKGIELGGSGFHRVTHSLSTNHGCGMGGYLLRDTLFQGNEVSRSLDHECKFADGDRITIRDHYAHDFGPDAALLWFDGGAEALVERARLVCSPDWPCIDIEIHRAATLQDSTLDVSAHGAWGGVWVTASSDFLGTRNRFNGPAGAGVKIFWDGVDRTAQGRPAVTNNRFLGNTFNLGGGRKTVGFQCEGLAAAACRDYMLANGNRFASNRYILASPAGAYWSLAGGAVPWSQWQAAGQDVAGTIEF